MTDFFITNMQVVVPVVVLHPHAETKENAELLRKAAKHFNALADKYDPRENIVKIVKQPTRTNK